MVKHHIISASDIDPVLASCTHLATYMLFCSYYHAGCKLLEAVIRWRVDEGKVIDERDKLMLEVIWSMKPELRFADVPWQPFTTREIEQIRMKIRKSSAGPEPSRLTPPLDRFENTKIPALVDICRAYIEQPLDDGQWPYANARQAFEAMQETHDVLEGWMPVTHCWTFETELALCLGQQETQVVINRLLRLTSNPNIELHRRRDRWWMRDCLCFEGFIPASSSLPAEVLKMSLDHSTAMSRTLIAAIDSRIAEGQQIPLRSASWKELLERLSKAVNARHPGRWNDGDTFLHPPTTQDDIEIVEGNLGMSLPQDFKDMVIVHNG